MSRLTLLTKFSITSFVLLAIIGVLLGNALTQHFQQQAIEQQRDAISALIPPVVGPFLTHDLLANGAHGDSYDQIETALSYLGGSGLVRIKILNGTGTIIYSDDASLVGQRSDPTGELQQALDGERSASISPAPPSESIAEIGYGDLLVVYTPLRMPGKSAVSGVFEGYYDVTDLEQSISDTTSFLWTAIGVGFLMLYITLFTIVRNASRTLVRQSEENKELYQKRLTEREEAGRQAQQQVERLKALHNIDMAISSNLDLRLTLHVILTEVCSQLHVDAASVLLLDKQTQLLEYRAGRGFRTEGIKRSRIKMGEGYTGRAAVGVPAGANPGGTPYPANQHGTPQVIEISSTTRLRHN